jgi:hypothetical protein
MPSPFPSSPTVLLSLCPLLCHLSSLCQFSQLPRNFPLPSLPTLTRTNSGDSVSSAPLSFAPSKTQCPLVSSHYSMIGMQEMSVIQTQLSLFSPYPRPQVEFIDLSPTLVQTILFLILFDAVASNSPGFCNVSFEQPGIPEPLFLVLPSPLSL